MPYLHLKGEIFHQRCLAHILNLVVQEGLSKIKSHIETIRELCVKINSSCLRLDKWKESCRVVSLEHKKIPLDVETRWNATFKMLEVALEYKKAIEYFCRTHDFEAPTEEQWKSAMLFKDFLKIFDSTTSLISGIYYPTTNLVIQQIGVILNCFGKYFCEELDSAYTVMINKYEKYLDTVPLAYRFALILDLRHRLQNFETAIGFVYPDEVTQKEIIEETKDKLKTLYEEYERKMDTASQSSSTSPIIVCSEKQNNLFWNLAYIQKSRRLNYDSTPRSKISSELERYCEADVELDSEKFDVLYWWKAHKHTFPVLSTIARDILTIPVSTVASEAAFSAGGRLISETRSRLREDTVEALSCLKDWLLAESRRQEVEVKQKSQADYEAMLLGDVQEEDGDLVI